MPGSPDRVREGQQEHGMSIRAPARKFDRHPIRPLCSKDAFQQAQHPDHHPHPPRRPHPRRHVPPHRLRIRRNRTETPRRFRKPHRQRNRQPHRHRRGDRLRSPERHPDPRTRTARSGAGTATCRPHHALRGRHLPAVQPARHRHGRQPAQHQGNHRTRRPVRRQRRHRARARLHF